ncbi:MAG: hypothetical protein LBB66_05610, partial [Desulfovibrio sp.]|jgi:hypothetical protein|nr:hypothetical protein [Desulfovibrio sp.]
VTFTLKQGGSPAANTNLTFAANPNFSGLASAQTTGPDGKFTVSGLTALNIGSQTLSATVDGQTVTVTFTVNPSPPYELIAKGFTGGGDFAVSTTATIKVLLLQNGSPCPTPTPVTWEVVSAVNRAPAIVSGYGGKQTGLAWGATPTGSPGSELAATATSATGASDGVAFIELTDVMGRRTVAVRATVSVGGQDYTVTQSVNFGDGPLAVFSGPPQGQMSWMNAVAACGGTYSLSQPLAAQPGTKLPSVSQLQAVDQQTGKGAAYAAGWGKVPGYDTYDYWSNEAGITNWVAQARYVRLTDDTALYLEFPDSAAVAIGVCLP